MIPASPPARPLSRFSISHKETTAFPETFHSGAVDDGDDDGSAGMNQPNERQSQTGNLGQKDAQNEKQKETDLSRMGEKTREENKQQKKQRVEDEDTPE
jgi:hypothetical protein